MGSGENYIMRNFIFCVFTKYCSGDQVEKNERGVACSAYGGDENCLPDFGGGKLMERNHLEEPSVNGRMILRWILGSGMWGME